MRVAVLRHSWATIFRWTLHHLSVWVVLHSTTHSAFLADFLCIVFDSLCTVLYFSDTLLLFFYVSPRRHCCSGLCPTGRMCYGASACPHKAPRMLASGLWIRLCFTWVCFIRFTSQHAGRCIKRRSSRLVIAAGHHGGSKRRVKNSGEQLVLPFFPLFFIFRYPLFTIDARPPGRGFFVLYLR